MASGKGQISVGIAALLAAGAGVVAKTCGKTARHMDDVVSVGGRHLDDSARVGSKADGVGMDLVKPARDESAGGRIAEGVAEELAFQQAEQLLEPSLDEYDEEPSPASSTTLPPQPAQISEPAPERSPALSVVGLLLAVLVIYNLFNGVWILFWGRVFGVPPLRLTVGSGPRLYAGVLAATEVTIHALPFSSSAIYREEEQVAEKLPGPLARAALGLAPSFILLLFSVGLLGTGALHSFANGFAQVPHLFWPGHEGVALISRFAEAQHSVGAVFAAGILCAKLAAAGLLFAVIQPFLWFGDRDDPPWWTVLPILLQMLAAVFVLINLLRFVF